MLAEKYIHNKDRCGKYVPLMNSHVNHMLFLPSKSFRNHSNTRTPLFSQFLIYLGTIYMKDTFCNKLPSFSQSTSSLCWPIINSFLKNKYVWYEKCFSFCYFSHHHSRHPKIYRFDLNFILKNVNYFLNSYFLYRDKLKVCCQHNYWSIEYISGFPQRKKCVMFSF